MMGSKSFQKEHLLNWSALLATCLLALLVSGCVSPSGGGVITLKQTQVNVSWKMTAYQNAAGFGNVTLGQQQQVTAANQAYEAAFRQALAEAHGNLHAPSPPNLQQLASELVALIDSVLATLT
jgi:hypothetical protein